MGDINEIAEEEQVLDLGETARSAAASLLSWKTALITLAVIFFVMTGVSLFGTPRHELIYSHHALTVPTKETIMVLYIMEFGNTGRAPISNVEVKLNRDLLRKEMLPVMFENHGVVERTVESRKLADAEIYDVGELKPGMIVECKISLLYKDPSEIAPWEDLLVSITPAEGEVHKGDPAGTTFIRIVYSFLDLF